MSAKPAKKATPRKSRNVLSFKDRMRLAAMLQRDSAMLGSGTMTWDALTARYSQETGLAITSNQIRGTADGLAIEVIVRNARAKRGGFTGLLLSMCQVLDGLATRLGENQLQGLPAVRQFIDEKVRAGYTVDDDDELEG